MNPSASFVSYDFQSPSGSELAEIGRTMHAMVGDPNVDHASGSMGQPTLAAPDSDVRQTVSSSAVASAGVVESTETRLQSQPMDTGDSVESSPVAQVHSEAQSTRVVPTVVVTDCSSETGPTLDSSQAGVSSFPLYPEASPEATSHEVADGLLGDIKSEKGSPLKAAGATAPLAIPEEFSVRQVEKPAESSSGEDD